MRMQLSTSPWQTHKSILSYTWHDTAQHCSAYPGLSLDFCAGAGEAPLPMGSRHALPAALHPAQAAGPTRPQHQQRLASRVPAAWRACCRPLGRGCAAAAPAVGRQRGRQRCCSTRRSGSQPESRGVAGGPGARLAGAATWADALPAVTGGLGWLTSQGRQLTVLEFIVWV